jgi:hypothetical protein
MHLKEDKRWVKKKRVRNKTQNFPDECERVEVEQRFSLASANAVWG